MQRHVAAPRVVAPPVQGNKGFTDRAGYTGGSGKPVAMQYIFLNNAPGVRWNQARPESVGEPLFREPLAAVGQNGTMQRRLGLSFILSGLDAPLPILEATLDRLTALSVATDTPLLIVLDAENWWGHRPDLWNWFDRGKAGYDPENRKNVEWTGPTPDTAVSICWRNWGRQIRVLPAPNLAAPAVRTATKQALLPLARRLRQWGESLPREKRYLFPGVKIGWEASIGINAYHYPGGNDLREHDPKDDPTTGLKMSVDFSGGLSPLGYAALASKGWQHAGPITLTDQERLVNDYLVFLTGLCREAGLKREQVFTHAGGQFAPWEKHYSHRIALTPDSLPGWSFYGVTPEQAGDLDATLRAARLEDWCAAEWLPGAKTAAEWETAYNKTLSYRNCRHLSVYNWEGIRGQPEAIEGLRLALKGTVPVERTNNR